MVEELSRIDYVGVHEELSVSHHVLDYGALVCGNCKLMLQVNRLHLHLL
jgi:hypothetical protein